MILYHYTITMTGILSPSFSFGGKFDDIIKTAVSVGVILMTAVIIIIISGTMKNKQPKENNQHINPVST